jgi:hypothetical protein
MHRPASLVDDGRARAARRAVPVAAACVALAACGSETRVQLVPLDAVPGSTCGRPADARTVRVIALGDFAPQTTAIPVGAPVDLADLPADTRQLAVEVLGAGGALAAIGKSLPLELGELDDGAVIPVAMAPPDGFCPVGALGAARDTPLVVRAGTGALVLGGTAGGAPVVSAELYDARTGRFEPVEVPAAWRDGFAGVAATPLADGRVLVTGGAAGAYALFDPASRRFERPGTLAQVRAFHAAVALDEDRVLLAGGCPVAAGAALCGPGDADRPSLILTLSTGGLADGPPVSGPRTGGTAVLEASGDTLTGAPRVLIAGGSDGAGRSVDFAERVSLDGTRERLDGAAGLVAPLDSGSLLVAFAPAVPPALSSSTVIVPGRAPVRVAATEGGAGATLTTLEDGSVLAIAGEVTLRYRPETTSWRTSALRGEAPTGIVGHGAVRLDDGSVLVVGGRDAADASAAAYLFRPGLTGPFAGAISATPDDDSGGDLADDNALTPLDPSRFAAGTRWRLDGADGGRSWAIIGGPLLGDGVLEATVRTADGVAAVVGFVEPARFDAVEIAAGAPARLVRHRPGAVTEVCAGTAAALGALTMTVTRTGSRVVAVVTPVGQAAGTTVLDCVADEPDRGRWGLAPVGAAGGLDVDVISLRR